MTVPAQLFDYLAGGSLLRGYALAGIGVLTVIGAVSVLSVV
jgi:hypothetical protein